MADTTFTTLTPDRHARTTRLIHAGLALAVIVQLVTSLIMDPDEGGDAIFEVHEYSGLTAFVLVLAFWVNSMIRQRGTPLAMLLPWFDKQHLRAVWDDIKLHLAALRHGSMPPHGDRAPLASAIHGLGLLLMTAMATSGTIYYLVGTGDPDAGGLVGVVMLVHKALANLVWAYLIGHASMAVLAHLAGILPITSMWSLGRRSGR